MDILLRALLILGVIMLIFANIWLLVVAFREGAMHGVLMLLFGWIYAIIFSIMYWDEARKPFLMSLIGSACFLGSIIFKSALAVAPSSPGEPASMTSRASSSDFKQKLAQAIAAQIAAKMKKGSPQTTQTTGTMLRSPSVNTTLQFKPVQVSQPASNAPAPAKSLLALVTRESSARPAAAPPPSMNAWEEARALLRVSGFMKTGTQVYATVNQTIVKVNDNVSVNLNGHTYRFKVSRIDLRTNTVKFDPLEP